MGLYNIYYEYKCTCVWVMMLMMRTSMRRSMSMCNMHAECANQLPSEIVVCVVVMRCTKMKEHRKHSHKIYCITYMYKWACTKMCTFLLRVTFLLIDSTVIRFEKACKRPLHGLYCVCICMQTEKETAAAAAVAKKSLYSVSHAETYR